MGVYLKKTGMPLEQASIFIKKYCTDDFLEEAQYTLKAVYKSGKTYYYKNSTIATLLRFTPSDFQESHCCYNEALQKERKKAANRRAKDKIFADSRKSREKHKEYILQVLKGNEQMSNCELADLCGVSIRTLQRYKQQLKENVI